MAVDIPNLAIVIKAVLVDNSGTIIGIPAVPVRVDPTGTTTQPVSGTVTANAGSGTFNVQDVADGSTGSAVPTKAIQAGASDGTNLQALQVESSTNKNLRIGIYQGGNEASVTGANRLVIHKYGAISRVDIANPAPGTSWTYTTDAGTVTRIISARTRLVTSATAGNRYVVYQSSGNNMRFSSALGPITANQTVDVVGVSGSDTVNDIANSSQITLGMAADLVLGPSTNFSIGIGNVDTADQLSLTSLLVEKWVL